MPSISTKGKNMPESPIRKLVPYAENAKKNGIKVFHLNIGQPDIKTPKVALDAIKNNTVEVLAYSRSEGSEEYRQKIADYYACNSIDVTSNEIIVTTGGSEALLFAMGSITDPGDEIIIPDVPDDEMADIPIIGKSIAYGTIKTGDPYAVVNLSVT